MNSRKHTDNEAGLSVAEKPNQLSDSRERKSVIQVLSIEDSAAETLIIQQMLKPTAAAIFHLRCVDCVELGIQELEVGSFDVVLLDLMLPDSVGLDSFSRVYARHPNIPIVVLTGIDKEQLVSDALQKGAQDYLIKGKFNQDTLIRSIQYAIERNRRQQAERIILKTQLEERRRLARELHDGVIQSLSAMRLQLQILDKKMSQTGDSKTATTIQGLAKEALAAIHEIRQLSHDLHPSLLDRYELPAAIESYGKRLGTQYGLAIEITNQCTQAISDHVKNHLYRIVQESMRNAATHASANRLCVMMRDQDFFITVEVHDDGIGFDQSKVGSAADGLGLISMRERAQFLGGSVQIQSQSGAGTSVLINVPF